MTPSIRLCKKFLQADLYLRSHMRFCSLFASLCLLVFTVATRAEEVGKERKPFVLQVAKDVSHLGLHKVYVPDFCDSASHPDGAGAFFAATISQLLASNNKDFTVASRVEGHRLLQKIGLNDCDLARVEVVSKFSGELGVDSIIWGTFFSDDNGYTIELSIRDLAGKELSHSQYREPHNDATDSALPAAAPSSGWPFYFVKLDGVGFPKCLNCANPNYSESARRDRVNGTILLSGVVTTEGRLEQLRVVKKLDPDLDKESLRVLSTWRLEPAKNSDGAAVPVRTVFQVSFRFYGPR